MGWSEKSREIKLKINQSVNQLNGWRRYIIYAALVVGLFSILQSISQQIKHKVEKNEESKAIEALASSLAQGLHIQDSVALERYDRLVDAICAFHPEARRFLRHPEKLDTQAVKTEILEQRQMETEEKK